MSSYLIFIVIVVLICLIFNGQDEKSRKICVALCGFFLVLVAGLRNSNVGIDTPRYVAYYLEYGKMSFAELWSMKKDPGFFVFSKVLYMIYGDNYSLYLLTIAALFQIPVSKLIYDHSPNLLLSHLLFMSMGFFYFSMTGIRQTLAMAATCWGFIFLLNGSWIKAVVAVLIGSLFHRSGLAFLVGIIMAGRKVNYKTILLYAAITVFFIVQGEGVVSTFLGLGAEYLEDDRFTIYSLEGDTLKLTGFIQLVLYFVLAFFLPSSNLLRDKKYMMFLNLLILSIIMQSLAIYIAEFFRVAMYFSLAMVAFIPQACNNTKYKRAITIGLDVFLIFYYILLYSRMDYTLSL